MNAILYGPNTKFNAFIKIIKDDIDLDIILNNHTLHDDLANAARAKYNKMVASDEYYELDTKDANIFALMTNATAIEKSVSANLANVTSSGGFGGGYRGKKGEKIAGVEKLRTVNKCDTIQHEGKTSWCRTSHKHKDGLFDDLNVWHKP